MTIGDFLGCALAVTLLLGFGWALIDLLLKIHRQPKRKRPFSFLRLTSYPFVPDHLMEREQEQPSSGGRGGPRLRPVPVPVRIHNHRIDRRG